MMRAPVTMATELANLNGSDKPSTSNWKPKSSFFLLRTSTVTNWSSKASSVDKEVYGAEVPVLYHENLSMRLLIDHSVVESFAQGGRAVITVRIYPTEAIYKEARLFVFNNATNVSVVASLKIWEMKSLSFEDYKD
ncbi:hypothetical protein L1049_020877 [Liquidambar formosana]|uniref:Glycosyl hydrolase family 32 C-terminal domain-containing protein n=1 Tax=Liquidambar formosana TaxID=63359 RepID=A0AAP0S8M2_LIQFO